jgi:hypothetical protein
MAIPPVLRLLLTAHGPSGYETAPAAAFRDAASAFAEVTTLKGFVEERREIVARGGEGIGHVTLGLEKKVMARSRTAPRDG